MSKPRDCVPGWMRRLTATAVALAAAMLNVGCDEPSSSDAIEQRLGAENGGGGPLSGVPVPQPVGGDIVNGPAAVRLGKALFWDEQTGGDGRIACATCHFRAGGDNRTLNTLHPGGD